MQWRKVDLLTDEQSEAIQAYIVRHPVLARYADTVCVALSGSYAFGLGGPGADIDLAVLCPDGLFEDIRARLVADGRFGEDDEPGEDIAGVVGDYVLQPAEAFWESVRDYRDLTQVFICANLIPLCGRIDVAERLTAHCATLPPAVVKRAYATEVAQLDQSVYAFLRSFQTGDRLGRLLSRANILRAAMRTAFLAERLAPPYDKHLARLLTRLPSGQCMGGLIASRFGCERLSDEDSAYAGVAAAPDWRRMYAAAVETPVMQFVRGVRELLDAR